MKTKLFHVTVHWPQNQDYWGEWETVINVFLVYCKNKDEVESLIADTGIFNLINWDKDKESIEQAYPGLRVDYVEVEGAPVTARNHVIFVKSMVE